MEKVGIVTDTISCVPQDIVREYGIQVVPTGLVIDGRDYRDTDLSNDEFWKLFYQAKKHPTTNAVSPADFLAAFNQLDASVEGIVVITVSAALSATHAAAQQAKEMFRKEKPTVEVEVIDSKTAAGAEGFVVIEAAKAAREGKSFREVVQVASAMLPRVKFVTAMETLKYLIQSGRAPKTAVIGDMLKVKPIIGMVSGTGLVESLGRARGKKKALEKLAELAEKNLDTGKPLHVMFHYTDGIGLAEELRDIVASKLKCEKVYFSPYTPVMASQTGPVVAVSFYNE
jgi:DegV family protein with EDD domain